MRRVLEGSRGFRGWSGEGVAAEFHREYRRGGMAGMARPGERAWRRRIISGNPFRGAREDGGGGWVRVFVFLVSARAGGFQIYLGLP